MLAKGIEWGSHKLVYIISRNVIMYMYLVMCIYLKWHPEHSSSGVDWWISYLCVVVLLHCWNTEQPTSPVVHSQYDSPDAELMKYNSNIIHSVQY